MYGCEGKQLHPEMPAEEAIKMDKRIEDVLIIVVGIVLAHYVIHQMGFEQ